VYKKRTAAFTLLEILFGMIISGCVIAAGYLGYEMVIKRYISFRESGSTLIGGIALDAVIQSDLISAKTICRAEEGFICKDSVDIEYQFRKTYVLRKKNTNIDTFQIVSRQPFYFYEGKAQEDKSGYIDRITFFARILNEEETFEFWKEYGAEHQINRSISE
jgi:hypothetical protein